MLPIDEHAKSGAWVWVFEGTHLNYSPQPNGRR